MDTDTKIKALSEHVASAIDLWSKNRPRSAQTERREVGASDVGFCREYVRRLIVGEEFTDDPPTWAATVGTALHHVIEQAMINGIDAGLALSDDDLLTFEDGEGGITTTMPSGFEVRGHPDAAFPKYGIVPDWKSKDGLATIRRGSPSEQQWWQVSIYALGLHQAGLLEVPLDEVIVALVYFDRSGRDPNPVVHAKVFDMLDVVAADQWLEDVTYAVRTGEVAMKDKPLQFCETSCRFFTSCRADDLTVEGGLITDPHIKNMIDQYLTAHAAIKENEALKEEAKNELVGTQGSTGEITVKWTHVNATELPATFRNGYDRLNVRRLKKG